MSLDLCTAGPCALAGVGALLDAARAACTASGAEDPVASGCLGRCELAPVVRRGDAPLGHATADAVRALIAGTLDPDPEGGRTPRPWRLMEDLVDGPDFDPEDALAAFATARLRLPSGDLLADALRSLASASAPRLVVAHVRPGRAGAIASRVLAEELPELLVEGLALAALCGAADGALVWCGADWPLARHALERTITRYGEAFPVPLELMELAALPTPGGAGASPIFVIDAATLVAAASVFRRGAAWWTGLGGVSFVAVTGHMTSPGVVELTGDPTVGDALAAAGGPDGALAAIAIGDGPELLGPDALALTLSDAARRAGARVTDTLIVARAGTDAALLAHLVESR